MHDTHAETPWLKHTAKTQRSTPQHGASAPHSNWPSPTQVGAVVVVTAEVVVVAASVVVVGVAVVVVVEAQPVRPGVRPVAVHASQQLACGLTHAPSPSQ
jgi:hypothetical protein